MKTIQLQIIDDQDHREVTLINAKGDKFTFNPLKHEGFDSFLSGCKIASDGDLAGVVGRSEQLPNTCQDYARGKTGCIMNGHCKECS